MPQQQPGGPRIDAEELEELIAETVRTWNDRLRDALIEKHGELEGRLMAERADIQAPSELVYLPKPSWAPAFFAAQCSRSLRSLRGTSRARARRAATCGLMRSRCSTG